MNYHTIKWFSKTTHSAAPLWLLCCTGTQNGHRHTQLYSVTGLGLSVSNQTVLCVLFAYLLGQGVTLSWRLSRNPFSKFPLTSHSELV